VEHLEEDLGVLKELFMAGGEGLSPREVEEVLGGLRGLMRVMALDTGEEGLEAKP
jgi:acyl-CoA synthetase (AMP-forming)/AMP-acid ligase II